MHTRSFGKVTQLQVNRCDKCKQSVNELLYPHHVVCDYYHFRDFEAPKLGFGSLQILDGPYISNTLDLLGVHHRLYKLNGISSVGYEIFADPSVIGILTMFYDNYDSKNETTILNLTLDEYLTKMFA